MKKILAALQKDNPQLAKRVLAVASPIIKKAQKVETKLEKNAKNLDTYLDMYSNAFKDLGFDVPGNITNDLEAWKKQLTKIKDEVIENLYELSIQKEVKKLRKK